MEVTEFQIGDLVWFFVKKRMPDMKCNKVKYIGPCSVVSVLDRSLLKFLYEVNDKNIKHNRLHPQFYKRCCKEPLLKAI